MSREHILNGVYVSETGTRSEIVSPGVYVVETVAPTAPTTQYAAFSIPQRDGVVYTQMIGY